MLRNKLAPSWNRSFCYDKKKYICFKILYLTKHSLYTINYTMCTANEKCCFESKNILQDFIKTCFQIFRILEKSHLYSRDNDLFTWGFVDGKSVSKSLWLIIYALSWIYINDMFLQSKKVALVQNRSFLFHIHT